MGDAERPMTTEEQGEPAQPSNVLVNSSWTPTSSNSSQRCARSALWLVMLSAVVLVMVGCGSGEKASSVVSGLSRNAHRCDVWTAREHLGHRHELDIGQAGGRDLDGHDDTDHLDEDGHAD